MIESILKGAVDGSSLTKTQKGGLVATAESSQTVPWSVTPVTMSGMPDKFLESRLTRILNYKAPLTVKDNAGGENSTHRERIDAMINSAFADYDRLRSIINTVQTTYKHSACLKEDIPQDRIDYVSAGSGFETIELTCDVK